MLEISGICKSYHKQVILEGAELMTEPGDCVGTMGHNGYRRTTLLPIISGTLKVDKGSIIFNDRQTVEYPRVFAEEAAYVPQKNPLMEELTVRDNLPLWYKGSRKGMEEDLRSGAAAMSGVDKMLNRMAGKLSGGMEKRVSIACALSDHAFVLIIDEPGAALDPECKELIRNYFRKYMAGDGAVVLTSHELVELAPYTQMHMLRQGRSTKIENGLSASELISQLRQKYSGTYRICMDPTQGRRKRMECTKCGAEYGDEVKFCTQRGVPLDNEGQETKTETAGEIGAEAAEETAGEAKIVEEIVGETVAETAGETAAQGVGSEQALVAEDQPLTVEDQTVQPIDTQPVQTPAGESSPNKKFMEILFAVIATVFVTVAAALAYVKMTAKDPKRIVINAFESVYKDDQMFLSEELSGSKDFADTAPKEDRESDMTLKMDNCSDPNVNAFAGSGLRLEGREDRTNGRNAFNMGMIYNGMDLANLDAHYGDDTLMVAIPELSSRMFTVNLKEGPVDRIKNSPTTGSMLVNSGVDADSLAGYPADLTDEVEKAEEEEKAPFDIEAPINRYKEDRRAQDNFKAVLTVTKADKGIYIMNGAQVSCQGYDVVIGKGPMIEFLRTSSDFLLQDETPKGDYLKQLEVTVRMNELMGGAMTGADSVSAQRMQGQIYDEVKETMDEVITYLEKSLTDMQMTVYVDRNGDPATVDGSTNLYVEGEPGVEDGYVAVNFRLELQGGAYLAQNLTGSAVLEGTTDTVTVDLLEQGTYDGKKLTCDLSVGIGLPEDANYNFMYTGTCGSTGGSYHAGVEVGGEGFQILRVFATGVMDQLGKDKNFHTDIGLLEIAAMDSTMNAVLSGKVHSRPLSSEVTPPEGESLDVLAATEQDRNNVLTEAVFGMVGPAGQLDVPMHQGD